MPNTKPGFTLIEILISLVLIIAIIIVLFASTGTLSASRGSNLQSIATKIASRQIETLRKTAYASLPPCPSPAGCTITDSDLAKLPSSSAKQFLDTYEGSPDMKLATIQVDWITNGAAKQLKIDTLIYKNGL